MDDKERLCAMEPHVGLRRFALSGTTRSVGQHLTHRATGAPVKMNEYSE